MPPYDFLREDDDPPEEAIVEYEALPNHWQEAGPHTEVNHLNHWFFGDPVRDDSDDNPDWASLRIVNEEHEALGGYFEGWTIELYPGVDSEDDIDRWRADSKEEAREVGLSVMLAYIERIR